MPMPLSWIEKRSSIPLFSHGEVDLRSQVSMELDGISDKVLQEDRHLRLVGHDRR